MSRPTGDSKPRLLVTGGGGMVGRNLLAHSGMRAFTVHAPDRAELDLADPIAVRGWMHRHKPDAIVHCAARVGSIEQNSRTPERFLVENLQISLNVIDAALSAGVTQFINIGSTNAYPANVPNSVREEALLAGEFDSATEGYGLAKAVSTRLCSYIDRSPEKSYKTVMPCNLYGEYDNFDPKRSHLVPSVITKVAHAKRTGAAHVEIWGDGTARRQLLFAADLADFLVYSLHSIASLPSVVNVAPSASIEVNEVYQTIADVVGWTGRFTHDMSKPVGTKRRHIDSSRMAALGWLPKTSFRSGAELTYKYYLEQSRS